jgi:hypothetical protein
MSDEPELGIVLANARRLEKAFERKWAAVLTLVSLYFARKRPGMLGLANDAGPDRRHEGAEP